MRWCSRTDISKWAFQSVGGRRLTVAYEKTRRFECSSIPEILYCKIECPHAAFKVKKCVDVSRALFTRRKSS